MFISCSQRDSTQLTMVAGHESSYIDLNIYATAIASDLAGDTIEIQLALQPSLSISFANAVKHGRKHHTHHCETIYVGSRFSDRMQHEAYVYQCPPTLVICTPFVSSDTCLG